MTDQLPPDATALDDGHPSLEELSSFLDGELGADRDEAARLHAAGCDSCAVSLASMADAVTALSAPVTDGAAAPAGAAAAAIARAIQSLEPAATSEPELDPRTPAGDAGRMGTVNPFRRRQRRVRLAGIAAALLVVAGLASSVGYFVDHGASSASSGAPSEHFSAAATTTAAPRTGGGAAGGTTHGPANVGAGRASAGVALGLLEGAGSCSSGSLPPGERAELNLSTSRAGRCLFVRPLLVVSAAEIASLTVIESHGHTFTATIGLASTHVGDTLGGRRAVAEFDGGARGVVTAAGRRALSVSDLTAAGARRLEQLLGRR